MIVLSILIAHLMMHSIFLSYWWFQDSEILLQFLHTIMSVINRFHKSNTCTNLERLIQFWIGYKKISPHKLSFPCKDILNNPHLKEICSLSSIQTVQIYFLFVNRGIHTMFFTIYTPSFWSTFHRKWSVILVYYLLMFVLIEKHTH